MSDKIVIGILGQGYIGASLSNYLFQFKDKYNLSVHRFDRSNSHEMNELNFTYFFNCTGITGDFRENIVKTTESNIATTSAILQNLSIEKALIALSSTRIYGYSQSEIPFDEELVRYQNHLNLDYVYDGSKLLMESMLWNEGVKKNYKVIIFRLSNVIGNFDRKDISNHNTFIKKLIDDKMCNLTTFTNQNINVKKDYVLIEDVVEAIFNSALSCQNLAEHVNIFNLASGQSYSLKELSKIFGFQIISNGTDHSSFYSSINIDKLKKYINYQPKKMKNLSINNLIK